MCRALHVGTERGELPVLDFLRSLDRLRTSRTLCDPANCVLQSSRRRLSLFLERLPRLLLKAGLRSASSLSRVSTGVNVFGCCVRFLARQCVQIQTQLIIPIVFHCRSISNRGHPQRLHSSGHFKTGSFFIRCYPLRPANIALTSACVFFFLPPEPPPFVDFRCPSTSAPTRHITAQSSQ